MGGDLLKSQRNSHQNQLCYLSVVSEVSSGGIRSPVLPLKPRAFIRTSCAEQVDAFKDYQPGAGSQAAASTTEETAEAEDAPGVEGMESESGASAGDFPEHAVLGLPALSPTMSQGEVTDDTHLCLTDHLCFMVVFMKKS